MVYALRWKVRALRAPDGGKRTGVKQEGRDICPGVEGARVARTRSGTHPGFLPGDSDDGNGVEEGFGGKACDVQVLLALEGVGGHEFDVCLEGLSVVQERDGLGRRVKGQLEARGEEALREVDVEGAVLLAREGGKTRPER